MSPAATRARGNRAIARSATPARAVLFVGRMKQLAMLFIVLAACSNGSPAPAPAPAAPATPVKPGLTAKLPAPPPPPKAPAAGAAAIAGLVAEAPAAAAPAAAPASAPPAVTRIIPGEQAKDAAPYSPRRCLAALDYRQPH